MKNPLIITIGREYGSGGRQIGVLPLCRLETGSISSSAPSRITPRKPRIMI